ncbi:MAG: HAD family hydrolase [Candidatus Omnitrophica bacterium]|jgi:phosphoglycolate phosphatase|nr:HAD family hydrolase [Candidatus Omnitrophota bacterium]
MSNNGFKKKLFIFDVDGTLVDAYQAIEKSLNFTRKKLNYPMVSLAEVKKKVGKGDKLFIAAFFNPVDRKEALTIYRNHHKKSLLKYSKLKPYAKLLLSALRQRNKILSIASNRPRYYTLILLNKLKIKKYFNSIYCADQLKSLKPNPKILNIILKRFNLQKEEAVYIGDMTIDLETARRAGVDAVFIRGGSSNLREVKPYRNKKVVANLNKILEIYN